MPQRTAERRLTVHLFSAIFANDPVDLPNHDHTYNQIIYIKRGTIELTLSGKNFTLGAGSLLLLSRFELHDINIVSKEYERYVICISSVGNTNKSFPEPLENIIFNRIVDCSSCKESLERIFEDIAEEATQNRRYKSQFLDLKLQELMIALYRIDPTLFPNNSYPGVLVIERLKKRFETDYSEDLRIDALAEEYHFSPSYLSHIFKEFTGYSPMAYLSACRLTAARDLLATTSLSVNDITKRCGFGDASNFCRCFKSRMDMTPLQYRKLQRTK